MLLHNFLIDERIADETDRYDDDYFASFSIQNLIQDGNSPNSDEVPLSLVTDNNEPKPVGRKTTDELELKDRGEAVRTRLDMQLYVENKTRPITNRMKVNKLGHVYFES